jgi:hypothetical protein
VKNMQFIFAGATVAALGFGQSARGALAQEALPPDPPAAAAPAAPLPDEANCGTWQNGTWMPNGSCAATDYRSRVSGTITAVKGHLVTVQQTAQSLVISDQPALERKTSGRVAVGRQVTAFGFWRGGVFYATRIV